MARKKTQSKSQTLTEQLKDATVIEEQVLSIPCPAPETTTRSLTTTDPGWTDYVKSQFTPEELIDNKPTCDGLRRIFELLIGEIVDSNLKIIKPPSNNDNDVSVEWHIRYIDRNGKVKSITDGFNVNKENTKYPWHLASIATAATRAEARALRKGLRLQKILSQEEVDQGFDIDQLPSESSVITSNQKVAIKSLCNRLNIDIAKLLSHLNIVGTTTDDLSYSDAHIVINTLNEFQRGEQYGGQSIPDNILLPDGLATIDETNL